MRKTLTIALVGVGLSLALASDGLADAADPNVSAPATVEENKILTVAVGNCSSGTGYQAILTPRWIRPDGQADDYPGGPGDGVTELEYRLTPAGQWRLEMTCWHVFDDGTWKKFWEESVDIDVLKAASTGTLTKAEKKKCKKKETRKARKRCLKKQRAD
jgi:hypothetical protein